MSSAEPAERSQNLDDLLSCIAQGDRLAMATLYQRTSPHLLGVMTHIHRGDRALAEQVLEDVYVRIWQDANLYDARHDQPMTWLMSIARQQAVGHLHEQRHSRWDNDYSGGTDLPPSDAPPPELVCSAFLARAYRRSMNVLSTLEQQCFALAFYQGMSHTEVAEQLRQPLPTIKACMRRALPALRHCMEARPTTGTSGRT